MKRNITLLMLLLISFFSLAGQEENFVKANYDKSEYQVEMHDGVKLYTIVYTPKDKSETYPILMQRTPIPLALRRTFSQKPFTQ
jgi:predicted acyl esterase